MRKVRAAKGKKNAKKRHAAKATAGKCVRKVRAIWAWRIELVRWRLVKIVNIPKINHARTKQDLFLVVRGFASSPSQSGTFAVKAADAMLHN